MKKLVKVLMMMALVFGAASCSDQEDAPVMPNNPSENQEEVDNPSGGETQEFDIAKMMKEEASEYNNVTFIDNTTGELIYGGMAPLSIDFSSFEDYATVITLKDTGIKYEIYLPAEEVKLNLKFRNDEGIFLGISENLRLNKDKTIPFEKELLGFRCDCDDEKHKHGSGIFDSDYYYRAENDYMTCLYDSPQLVQLEVHPNKSGEEQLLQFGFSDYKPLWGAGIRIIQAAK
ncbi:MAG: hypothetical protein UHE93_07625 [Muribaculaceae bacterium]|nr:hypothetical protein [Muribaculaceae bacterium]